MKFRRVLDVTSLHGVGADAPRTDVTNQAAPCGAPHNSTLIVMKILRDLAIEAAAKAASLPERFVHAAFSDAPWLDGVTEVSEEIACELFTAELARANVSAEQFSEFIAAYNAAVRENAEPYARTRSDAYSAVVQALAPFGRDDAFGEGDYWVIADSFSSSNPVVQIFRAYRFPPEALAALQLVLASYAGVLEELRIVDEDGDVVWSSYPPLAARNIGDKSTETRG